MSVTVGTPTVHTQQAGVTSYSFSHTVENEANRVLLVLVSSRDATVAADVVVSGVTYNGVAMGLVGQQVSGVDGAAIIGASLWLLVAPAVGANNVAITYAAGVIGQSRAAAVAFWGVDQVTPQDAAAVGTNANGANPALSIVTANANARVIGALGRIGATAPVYLSGQIVIANASAATASLDLASRVVASPGSSAMDMTLAAARYGYVVAALRELVFAISGAGSITPTGDGAVTHTPFVLVGDGLIEPTGAGLALMIDQFLTGAGAVSVTGYRSRATMGRSRRRDLRGYGRILPYISGGP